MKNPLAEAVSQVYSIPAYSTLFITCSHIFDSLCVQCYIFCEVCSRSTVAMQSALLV